MIFTYLKHNWLQFWRSPALGQSIVQNVILGIFGLYLILNMLFLSFLFGDLIGEHLPDKDLLIFSVALLLYYALLDLIIRFFLQKFPSILLKPYMILPLKKSSIAHYLLTTSLGSFYNLFPLFFIIPFFFISILGAYSGLTAFNFLLFTIGMVLFNNFLSFWIDKSMAANKKIGFVLLVLVLFLFFLEVKGYLQLLPILEELVAIIIKNPLLSAIPLALSFLLYAFLHRFFVKNMSIEAKNQTTNNFVDSINVTGLDRFGEAGKLMDLELKLIQRSRRAKSQVLISFVFLLYPLAFLNDSFMTSPYMLLMIGLLCTGMMALNHGQLMLSWNSLHFDLLQSRKTTIYDLFSAKYYILVGSCLLMYVLSLPYIFINPDIVLFNTAMLFFNMSGSVLIYMLLASFNSLRIDPNEGNWFNFSGFGAAHYLIFIPIMGIPALLYWIGNHFAGKFGGLFLIAFLGILGLVFHKSVIQLCVRIFNKNRYKIAAAFRKKG
jgi:hypothetical protein